jgi:outer membrane protein OmpA-like peptidoglycan-associated protein
MADSIVDSIVDLVTPQVASSLASGLGASTAAVQSGLGKCVAALLGGIVARAGDHGFMSQVFSLISGSNTQNALTDIPQAMWGSDSSPAVEQGAKLTTLILGRQQSNVESLIGQQSGLGSTGANGLMSLAAPLAVGYLGRQIRERNLNVTSFTSLIASENAKIQEVLPAAFGHLISRPVVPLVASTPAPGDDAPGGEKTAIGAVVALLAFALLAWIVAQGCNKRQEGSSTGAAKVVTPATTTSPGPLGEFITRKLPDGTDLNIPRLGIENQLIDFIEDSSKPVDKTTWFDFDRLTFETGKATLQDSSSEQLQNIAAILKAYPKVKAKIGGYTDNTGSKQANLRLSQDRSTNVMGELVQRSIDKSRLEAQGYGDEHPIADNSTAEGRAKNRRISLRVTEK